METTLVLGWRTYPIVIVRLAVASDHGTAAAIEQTCFDWRVGWMYYKSEVL